MCGLVGLISKNKLGFNRDQQEIFSSLLFVDLLRGPDSTGVFTVSYDGDVYVAKDAVHSLDFLQTKEYDEALRRAFSRGMAMIGHNRKATKGTIVDRNAHPFNVDDNIILVHNGTMSEDHTKHADVEVDSHAIAHLIHEKKDVGEALSSFWGAYALIWYDVQEATINIIRNNQRPLWWMETPTSWIWASTPDMLEFVKHRHDLKVVAGPAELPEDTLQQYKLLPDHSWEVTNEKVDIKRKSYYVGGQQNNSWQFGGPGGGRRQRFHEDQPLDDFDDYVERHWPGRGERETMHVPTQPKHSLIQTLPPPKPHAGGERVIDAEPVEFAGLGERERDLAKDSNNVMPYGEYHERIIRKNQYNWNGKIHGCPFDYSYVNGRDVSDGFYLYAVPVDGDSVILRQFMSSKLVTEERILQLASGGYIYEFTIGRKTWSPMTGGTGRPNYRNDEPGFVIVQSQGCQLLTRPSDKQNQPTIH